ncbi:hypothetical protein ACEQ8H_004484 [Pleosporales sp. CAS-2024a]
MRTATAHESGPDAPPDLMVTTRARRPNAGNRMSTLLATAADDAWGEEWDEAPDEEDFLGHDVDEHHDYNMDSSSDDDDDADGDGGDDDEAGEKELRKAERQERNKTRRPVTNPFAARVAAASRKNVQLDRPRAQSPADAPPRPRKKSERASWLPTQEDGPVRASARTQTVANKEATLSKLLEKDRRRDDTLAMMKAAEARKKKHEPKPLTQAERLAEAARNERINKKTLHTWEEAEEARAAERQAKMDALKHRQMHGPFIRYYSGPAIWVDDKLKYTGKDAPTLDYLHHKLNKEPTTTDTPDAQDGSLKPPAGEEQQDPSKHHALNDVQPVNGIVPHQPHSSQDAPRLFQTSASPSHTPSMPTSLPQEEQTPSQLPWTAASQPAAGDVFMGSHGMSVPPNSIMFAPPAQDPFLFGIDQHAQNQQSQHTSFDFPPNPFTQASQASPYNSQYATSHPPHLQQPYPPNNTTGPQNLPQQSQAHPPPPPVTPRKKMIRRALRNLLILSSFPNLDLPPSKSRTPASLLKDKDRAALIQLSMTLFSWSLADATAFVTTTLTHTSSRAITRRAQAERDAARKPVKPLCAVTNNIARYRDPETGIAYRDARAFGVLRGVVGGGFVWSGDLGCYVGGRAKPLESMRGKGFLGMPPAKGVPRRFLEMKKLMAPPPVVAPSTAPDEEATVVVVGTPEGTSAPDLAPSLLQKGGEAVKTETMATLS